MMRALLVLAVLLAPTASACSFGGPIPSPGAFTIVGHDGAERAIVVEGRLLGGSCELSNRHDLSGDLFVWAESERNVVGHPWDIHVLDLASGETQVLRDVARTNIEALGVYDRTVLAYWRDWSVMEGQRTLVAIDLDTGERRALDLPTSSILSVSIDGSHVTVVAGQDPGARRLIAYDDARRAVTAERDASALTSLRAVGSTWVIVDAAQTGGRSALQAHRIEDGWITPLDVDAWSIHLDGDDAYFSAADGIYRVHLPDGSRQTTAPDNGTLVSVHDGVRVYGRYSAPELNPLGPLWWIAQPTPQLFLLVAGVGIAGAGTAGTLWWKRRSM